MLTSISRVRPRPSTKLCESKIWVLLSKDGAPIKSQIRPTRAWFLPAARRALQFAIFRYQVAHLGFVPSTVEMVRCWLYGTSVPMMQPSLPFQLNLSRGPVFLTGRLAFMG